MSISLLYIFLSIIGAFAASLFLYFKSLKDSKKLPLILFFLRFLSILALLLVLLNPKWEKTKLTEHKPELVVAVDNSASIRYLNAGKIVTDALSSIRDNKAFQDKFNVNYYSFGEQIKLVDSLSFSESQTNPSKLFRQLKSIYDDKTPIILISDGNQSTGNSYEYYPIKNPIYPLVVGDTTNYADLSIIYLNTNHYAFLDNKFPVEIFSLYKGKETVTAQLSIYRDNNRVYTQQLSFSPEKNSQHTALMLPADGVGNHYYHAVIGTLKNEKNTHNNRKDFSVEIVDQQTNILIVSSFYHPDLGALKKSIESNKQRKATLHVWDGKDVDLSAYQLVILYQPTAELASIFKAIQTSKIGSFIITGTKTDWGFLNSIQNNFSKRTTQLNENYLALYNASFPEFITKDIGFSHLNPLRDKFGVVNFNVPFQTLLYQRIGSTNTEYPLLATYSTNTTKNTVLFGEGLWRWRMINKIENQSFKQFDQFLGTIIQYTASNKAIKQIHLEYDKLSYNSEEQRITATYVNQNFQLDNRASIWLHLTNKLEKITRKIPFSQKEGEYQVILSNLKPGNYDFQVKVDNKNVKNYGSFKVLNYSIEQQFTTANEKKMEKVAQQTGGKVEYVDQLDSLLEYIQNNPQYTSIQKSKKVGTAFIDFRWLLAIIVVSLSLEWFIRKYKGLV